MKVRRGFLLLAVLALLLGPLGTYLLSRISFYQEQTDSGPSPEVRRDPYLAAQKFLSERGLAVDQAKDLQSIQQLPSQGHSLLMPYGTAGLPQAEARRLLAWVAGGGHLLIKADKLWDEQKGRSGDPLLDALGVRETLSRARQKTPTTKTPDGKQDTPDPYPNLGKLYLKGEPAPAYINSSTEYHLYAAKPTALLQACSAKGCHLLQVSHGQGRATVLTDPGIWSNARIADQDHAWLLWYLTQGSRVTLLAHGQHESLAILLGRHFPQALTALALLLALGLWHAGLRQGPVLPSAGQARRRLEEHLRASADFRLRHGGHSALVDLLQAGIRQRMQHHHSGFERLDPTAQGRLLADLTRLPTGVVRQAMQPLPKRRQSAAHFTRQVTCLQQLRNAL